MAQQPSQHSSLPHSHLYFNLLQPPNNPLTSGSRQGRRPLRNLARQIQRPEQSDTRSSEVRLQEVWDAGADGVNEGENCGAGLGELGFEGEDLGDVGRLVKEKFELVDEGFVYEDAVGAVVIVDPAGPYIFVDVVVGGQDVGRCVVVEDCGGVESVWECGIPCC